MESTKTLSAKMEVREDHASGTEQNRSHAR